MTAMAGVLDRIARATSVRRTRADDDVRQEIHGGSPAVLRERVESAVDELRKVATKLEASLDG